jgi:sugar phosphate isomerase/epimerase
VPRIGLGSYALRWAVHDLDAASACRVLCQTAGELGLELLQIADNVALLELDQARQRELRRAADDASLRIEVGTRSYRAADFRRMLRLADAVDSRTIRLVGDDSRLLARLLARVGGEAQSWGGRVIVENYFPVRSDELLTILKAAGDWVGTCVDTANSIPCGEWPLETLARLLPLADAVHLKDFRFESGRDGIGFLLTGAPIGRGQQDVRAIVQAAVATPHHPPLILEQWLPWQSSRRTTLRAERSWLELGVAALNAIVADVARTGEFVTPRCRPSVGKEASYERRLEGPGRNPGPLEV